LYNVSSGKTAGFKPKVLVLNNSFFELSRAIQSAFVEPPSAIKIIKTVLLYKSTVLK
jgi:hypothetical protein